VGNEPLGVDVVNDDIGIALVTGSEDDQLKLARQLLKTLLRVGPHVDSRLHHGSVGEANGQQDVAGHVGVLVAMDQGFIQVEDQRWLLS
jgi:hypothetical protein